MNNDLLTLLKNTRNPSLYLLVTMLVEDDKDIIIQKALNILKPDSVVEDGVIGYNTVKAIINSDEDIFANAIIEYTLGKGIITDTPKSGKEKIMGYLGAYEGLIVHWNKGETDITTPYGVYGKSFPNSKPILYVQKLAVKHTGHKITKRNLRRIALLNSRITRSEKLKIKNLCWEFYLENFMDKRVIPLLDAKSNLSYFSCSVNGGRGRGAKVLQQAVSVKPDGEIGNVTLRAIRTAKRRNVDINKGILDAMLRFYKYLIRINPIKFRRFRKGWFARIAGLR